MSQHIKHKEAAALGWGARNFDSLRMDNAGQTHSLTLLRSIYSDVSLQCARHMAILHARDSYGHEQNFPRDGTKNRIADSALSNSTAKAQTLHDASQNALVGVRL